MTALRGYLVDRCPRCGSWMQRASQPQHAVLQAVLEDIAKQIEWPPQSGQLHGPGAWWQLIVAAYDRTQLRPAWLMQAIDGEGFDGNGLDFVRGPRRRRNLNRAEIGEITEYARAWAVDRGVTFREFST